VRSASACTSGHCAQKIVDNIIHQAVFLYRRMNISPDDMGSAKTFRHGQILRLITSERIANQEDLRRRLWSQRLRVTQATLSRDLHELKLVKTPEGYRPANALVEEIAPIPPLARALGEFLLDIRPAENLLVLKTPPSGAQPLAAAVDGAKFPEIAGTIAGDDTVLIITPNKKQRESLQHKIESFVGRSMRSRAS
jgi:transcriptional regulator of arginine metabolism